MRLQTFFSRCRRAIDGMFNRPALAIPTRPSAQLIRLPRPAFSRAGHPIVRWRTNPVSGRLECRWILVEGSADERPAGPCFERFGAILAIRQTARHVD